MKKPNWPTKEQLEKFQVGDKVTSRFYSEEKNIVRLITSKEKSSSASGWFISADCGPICKECDRPLGTTIHPIDGNWFMPVEDKL